MRPAVLLVLVAGCRGLLGIEDPTVTVDAASTSDAPIANPACGPGHFTHDDVIASGTFFTPDRNTDRATLFQDGVVRAREGGIDMPGSSYTTLALGSSVLGPRLLDGTTLIMLAPQIGGSYVLVGANRTAAYTWSTPQLLTTSDESGMPVTFGADNLPGTAAILGTSVRFPVATLLGFDEYGLVVQAQSFKRVAVYRKDDLGVGYLDAPNYTTDGTRVVFVGQSDGAVQIMLAERAAGQERFGPARPLYDAPEGTEATPYLTADCAHLYYTDARSNAVHHLY